MLSCCRTVHFAECRGRLVWSACTASRLLPKGFFPDMDYDQLYIEYKLPEGVNSTEVAGFGKVSNNTCWHART